MTKEELLQKAKELGIENTETLKYNELRKQVKQAEHYNQLVLKARQFGIDENQSIEALEKQISDAEELIELTTKADELGIAYDENTDVAELKKAIKKATEKVDSYTDKNGQVWAFKPNAPKKFRYNGKVATQEEWLRDADAMEMMITGELSYLTLKTK